MPARSDKPQGRLELTWANKKKRLIARDDGAYEWVPQNDYRAREVRLLREAGTIGDVSDVPAADNLLIRGDSLHALTALTEIPAYAEHLVGKVKLIYIDPPFNTGQAFSQYDDGLEHSVWLTMMRDRFVQLRRLLAHDGSIWVHLDDNEVAYARVLMDEVFGRDNFVAAVIWEKTDSPRMDAKTFSVRHDTILVFRRSDATQFRRLLATDEGAHYNKLDEEGRRYYLNPLRARGGQGSTRKARPSLYFPMIAPDGSEVYPKLPSGEDGAWRWSQARVEKDAALIEWIDGRDGWTPWYRVIEPEERTRPPETIWPHAEVGSTRTSAYEVKKWADGEAFATPKPERLLQRVIHIATDPGDVVLDVFAGSGTTPAVAHKMQRRWVAVEWERDTIERFTARRLRKVVAGEEGGGISADIAWEGGGGFRVLDVAPSMYEDDEGVVVLADWATDNALAEAVAAQLGFDYEPDGPFCGRQGRTCLAVLDGHLSRDTARMLLAALGEKENISVVAVGLDPEADKLLRKERPGSRARVAPRDLLLTYAQPAAWQVVESPTITPEMNEQLAELEQLDLLADGGAS